MSFWINYLFIFIYFVINVGFIIGIPFNNGEDNRQLNNDNLPPLFFPNDTNLYKIIPNDNKTALKILSHSMNNDKNGVTLPKITEKKDDDNDEVDYYTEDVDKKTVKPTLATKSSVVTTTTNVITLKNKDIDDDDDTVFYDDANDVVNADPKLDVEGIQSDNKERTSDELEENFQRSKNQEFNLPLDDTLTVDLTKFHGGHIAGIFATTFVAISIIAYITLIIWRARLEKKYGNRERLVTEDDYYNNNDMRHFEL